MRITTVLMIIACLLATCLAGCTGQAKLLPANSVETAASPWDSYDPFAPAVETMPAKAALSAATGINASGFNIVALDRQNNVDLQVQEALQLEATPNSLVISLQQPLPYLGLYIRYDSTTMHATSFDTDSPGSLGLAVEPEAGLIAVGICAFGDNNLGTGYTLATISFAQGASVVEKRLSAISQQDSMKVRDLEAIDGGEDTATLGWSERNTGDYDLNSEVNLADITQIAINFQASYDIDSPDYAQLEIVDGDENGEINMADITPIAINFFSTVNGYNVYRMPLDDLADEPTPADAGWELIPHPSDPGKPTIEHQVPNGQDFRVRYTLIDDSGNGAFAWYVAPVGPDGAPVDEGPAGNVAKVLVTGTPPDAGLSFVIMPPNGPLMNLNDEFYLGIQIAEVVGLFSANVRFEYDGSLIELVESVSTYDVNVNLLEPPLFIAADDVGAADSPYVLLGFNATQTQGTAVKDGTGFIAYFKFKVINADTNLEALRFPVASTFFHLWGDQYGVPIATPAFGSPQVINAG